MEKNSKSRRNGLNEFFSRGINSVTGHVAFFFYAENLTFFKRQTTGNVTILTFQHKELLALLKNDMSRGFYKKNRSNPEFL